MAFDSREVFCSLGVVNYAIFTWKYSFNDNGDFQAGIMQPIDGEDSKAIRMMIG